MKWANKGHEFDNVYANMKRKKRFYLYGAGDYGRQFFTLFKDEINIVAYIDNDTKKHGTYINNLICMPLEQMTMTDETGIIVTMSQIGRRGAIERLQGGGGN